MADPRPSTIPYPSTRNENLSSRDPPRLQNIAASLAKPGDVYARGEQEEEGEGEVFCFAGTTFPEELLVSFFPADILPSPAFSPRHPRLPTSSGNLFNSRPRVWHDWSATGYPRPRAEEEHRNAFCPRLPVACLPISLSLLPLFSSNEKRNGGCWLVSSSLSLSPIPLFLFFLLLLRISNASRWREKFEETAAQKMDVVYD